ncbi:MAG: pantoate--beta-alanine ligase [Actinomycetota bacterium]|nr:pantoate--beta-alanine ligase [Actinomycetota bacterium]
MELVRTADELAVRTAAARGRGEVVGLVPTMGALHDGHASLIATACAQCGFVVVSIFVNPLQFGPNEDFAHYPRRLEADLERAGEAGADLVFAPGVEELYPEPVHVTVHVGEPADILEGALRPGHFDGVATVLTRLFNLVGPARAYFGEKDYQQLVIVRDLVRELRLPAEIVNCPTLREADGLARSSRNAYLAPTERAVAPVLHRALVAGASAIAQGERDAAAVRRAMRAVAEAEQGVRVDYLEVADPERLRTLARVDGPVRLLGALRIGAVRLIDNLAAAPGVNP